MKRSNLITGICYIAAGIVLLIFALRTDSRLGGLLWGFTGATIAPGALMVYKYFYWSAPKNRSRYQEMLEKEKIEMGDELKQKVRDKSGRYTYVLGLMVTSIAIVVFSVLDALEIIGEAKWMVLYLAGYLVFQVVAGTMIFNHILKKY